jgi:poly(3-hydroxybutyrate) depolymerase
VLAAVATALLPLLTAQDPAAAAPASLHAELARVVDLPDAGSRAKAAGELAAKNVATVEQWLAACASFGTFAPLEPGPTRHDVELRVLDQVERTEVFLYVPAGYDAAKPAPLLLWGHGAGGSGAREYLQWQAVANRVGLLVLAITAFDRQPGYHFAPRERAAALAALRWARRHANVDENAIFVGGWSQGGHQAWDLALRHPDRFAGALPVVGAPRLEVGPANNLRYLENVATLPIRDLQGSQDDARALANLRLAFARLQKLGAKDATLTEFPDRGHDADLAAVDWATFFAKRRVPLPKRVVRLVADPGETRAHWLAVTAWSPRAAPDAAPTVGVSYASMDDAAKRAHVLDRYAEHTARLQVDDKGQGRFTADGKLVTAFALLLVPAQVGKAGAVEVRWQSKTVKATASASAAVLLGEFAERFDRTFLPVARVDVR